MDGDSLYQDYDGYTVYYRGLSENQRCTRCHHGARRADERTECTEQHFSEEGRLRRCKSEDVTFQATMKLGEISGVQLGDTVLKNGTDYTVSSSSVTIAADVLKKLELGNHKVTVLTTEAHSLRH